MNITINNPAPHEATAWVFVGLPDKHVPTENQGVLTDGIGNYYRFVVCHGGIHVRATVPAGAMLHLRQPKVPTEDPAHEQFVVHPAIDLAKTVPWWWYEGENAEVARYWAPDAPKPWPSFFRVVEHSAAHQVWHVRCRHPQSKLTHDLWATIYSNQPTIEFVAHSVYGTTANDGQPQQLGLGQLWLLSHYPMHMDHAIRNGLSKDAGQNPDGTWAFPLARPQMLHRARRIETRGAILCAPDEGRKIARMTGQLSAEDWDGSWLALGAVPGLRLSNRMLNDVRILENEALREPAGSYWQPRPQCQPPWSPTTGEQEGFGASACGRVLAGSSLIDHMLWNTQSYACRPTANKEPDGGPMLASRHPNAETMGMRPDLEWGRLDRLGWPPHGALAWIDGYVCSDDEHRDDTTLHAMILLTQCPGLRAIAEDHIQIGLTEVRLKLGWAPAARATGRLLLAYANALHIGIGAPGKVVELISATLRVAGMSMAHEGTSIIGPIGEAKYGWKDAAGNPVMGWQPWQQAIAAIGLLAAHRALSRALLRREIAIEFSADAGRAKWLASIAAVAAVTHGFQEPAPGPMRHVYAVSTAGEKREDTAADYWTAAAAHIVLRLHGEGQAIPDAAVAKAKAIVAQFGEPTDWARAHWWAVGR